MSGSDWETFLLRGSPLESAKIESKLELFPDFTRNLAYLAAPAYAMEATTYQTAALNDSGSDDYMLETAILKVFTSEF